MSNFQKLSREEMKNVTGGVFPVCTMVCKTELEGADPQYPNGRYGYTTTYVQACTSNFEGACTFGGEVVSCTCGNI
ncbi:bacteriocin-like protein [Mucilaginibacter sp.]|uniref:bacteriocin-like protein n=1 Tax=Mucilaginibacter sp. TaxID=1882438 RepID=UPI003D0AC78A